MKNLKYLSVLFLSLLMVTACEEDDHEFGAIITPTSVGINAEIIGLDASFNKEVQIIVAFKYD